MKNKILELLGDEKNIGKYRSIPFWSWNDLLDKGELVRQVRWMKEQGFGGYFMHARGGLKTEYLGDEWFECIRACMDEGEKLGIRSWAYDENGWPSGFVGGKLLADPAHRDRYLTFTEGKFDVSALVSYKDDGVRLVRATEDGAGKYLNVYEHYSASTVDILNPEVVKLFIEETHEQYKARFGDRFGSALSGFFTDEPQYYRRRHPYTVMLPEFFKREYGEDIFERLGLIFAEREGYRDFRYKYWCAMQRLMLENFAKQVYGWCDRNGLQLTGHYLEESFLEGQMNCCAGIMPYYEYEHIPGIDKLGRKVDTPVSPRQVSSVARQLGKKQVLTETFAMCGWDVTPQELRLLAEWQFVNGANLICQHLLPYSEHGQRKRDYPVHFSWANPWVRHGFKGFNDYFARLGWLLGESEEIVNVALFSPIRSMYFEYKRDAKPRSMPNSPDVSYQQAAVRLSAMNIPYHILDETVMEKHADVRDGKLCVGECAYDFVLFPKTWTMGKVTAQLFEEFYEQGGRMLFLEEFPGYMEGTPHAYTFRSNTCLEEVAAAQEYRVDRTDTAVQSAHHRIGGKDFLYSVNTDAKKAFTLTFSGPFRSFTALDIDGMTCRNVGTRLTFAPGQSYVLFYSDEQPGPVLPQKLVVPHGKMQVASCSDNYMLLDKLRWSSDGVHYSERAGYMRVFNELLWRRYSGKLWLKYEFTVREVPGRIFFLSEDMNNRRCTINGHEITFDGVSDFEKQIYRADIAPYVRAGKNEAVLEIDFYEKEEVYYALFGEGVTESLKNCLTYDTTIESCYLQGDFGVFSEGGFAEGREQGTLLCEDDFFIARRRTEVEDTVRDGYPFFAGDMTLRYPVFGEEGACTLALRGRFCRAEIRINGKPVEKPYFAVDAEIGSYLKKGENEALITLYSGNRNLLGPHHNFAEEPLSVGPVTFDDPLPGQGGKAARENYSFVRFGLWKE